MEKSPNRSRVPPSMVLIGSGQLLTGVFVGYTSMANPNGTALTPWTPLGLRKAGRFYYSYVSSCVAPGTSLCGPHCCGKEVGRRHNGHSNPSEQSDLSRVQLQ
ncbi:hypothetical protein AVEN_265357-1 [Araneus ventricosus]|uniref:Uncharacterized protein n=1 Tax=Araneus ventricosus TaxID=182803 RepID=A0A4Y2N4I0_ARAVE|nr:hypothetical protein AVEN_265357-1 [Araneus ventricosus]